MSKALVFALPVLLVTTSALAANNLDAVSEAQRDAYLRRARAFNLENLADPVAEVGKRDLLNGMTGPGQTLRTGQELRCSYIAPEPGKRAGSSPKFDCRSAEGVKFKVKYQLHRLDYEHMEPWAEPIAHRLAWALGFASQKSWSVKVVCTDCPADPWYNRGSRATRVFEPATVSVNYAKQKIGNANHEDSGWRWTEIDRAIGAGGSTRAEIDALRLLAGLLNHGDLDTAQQRFVCADGAVVETSAGVFDCRQPVLALHDLGQTFGGRAGFSIGLQDWLSVPVFKDSRGGCQLGLKPVGGSRWFGEPVIGEEGRELLARLLAQLSDAQIADLFRAGRLEETFLTDQWIADRRTGDDRKQTIADWVAAFKTKRAEISARRCR